MDVAQPQRSNKPYGWSVQSARQTRAQLLKFLEHIPRRKRRAAVATKFIETIKNERYMAGAKQVLKQRSRYLQIFMEMVQGVVNHGPKVVKRFDTQPSPMFRLNIDRYEFELFALVSNLSNKFSS